MRRQVALLALFATGALLATCRTATEVTLDLSTDVDCVPPGTATGDAGGRPIDTTLYRGGGTGSFNPNPSTDTRACGGIDPLTQAPHRIGSIVLIPSGSNDEP